MNDKILTQGEKAFRNSEVHKSRTHLTRLTAVLLVLLTGAVGVKAQTANGYVIYYNGSFLTHNANGAVNTTASNTFDVSTCLWTITGNNIRPVSSDGTTVLGNFYLRPRSGYNTYSLNTNTSTNYTAWSQGVSNGGQPYYSTGGLFATYYYLRLNGTTWQVGTTNSNRGTIYSVTKEIVTSTSTNPTINGLDVLTATGNSNYTATGAAYRIGYTDYSFNGVHVYLDADGNSFTGTPANATLTNAWSLESNSYATVNNSGVVTVSSLPEIDVTLTLTVTATATGGTPAAPAGTTLTASKEITIQGTTPSAPIISVSGSSVTMSTEAAGTTTIRYTLDGTDPTASTGTVYSGAIDLSSSTTSPVTIKAVTVRDGNASDVTTQVVTLTLPEPVITADAEAGTATITCAIAGATIYYTTDGSEPSASNGTAYTSGLSSLAAMTTIKAIAVKDGWNNSPVASEILTISSGVDTSTKEVTLFDYEDHNYRYYQPSSNLPTGYPDQLHSPNPRNVKITYKGNGQLTDGTAVSGVKVGVDADANIFVYYKTLEKGTDGKYAYTTIPNPFSVRPKVGNTYYGFSHWKVISIDGGTIEGNPTTINAETEIKFNVSRAYTTNCQSMEVVLEAVWDVAEVSTNGTFSNNYGVERMFYVVSGGDTNLSTANKACTYSSFYPNGTTNGTAAASLNNRVTRYAGFSATYDSKIEYIILRNNNSTLNANGKNFTVGRGVSGYNNGVCATNLYGLAAASTSSFKFRVESGTYTNLYFLGQGRDFTNNALLTTTLGCDYDRAMVEGGDATFNQKMRVTADIALGMNATSGNTNNKGAEIFNCTVKSGNYDLGESNYGGGYQFYISAFGSNGTPYTYGKRTLVVEGGIFSDISGGMETEGVVSNSLRMVDIRIKGGTMNSAVYGAAQYSGAIGERRIVITGGTFLGWIAGGANGTKTDGGLLDGAAYVYVGGNAKVNSGNNTVINRAVGGNVFGAGCGYGSGSSSGQVSLGTTVVVADKAYVERGVYGGGSYGYTTQTSNVYILGGHVGGKNGGVSGTSYSADITGGVYGGACQNQGGTVNITMTDGLVEGGVYGGSNATGTLSGSVTMYIHGGQVGTPSSSANIHGGGYGSATRVSQTVELTLGTNTQTTPGVTVYGDVYGGSALGHVNGTAATNTYHTYVTMYKGIINGSLYGGGLGNADVAANVYGPVQVKVYGGSVRKTDSNGANGSGGVYGANNVNGAPQRAVTVDIYGTDPAPSANEYALFAVYGGGNKADYTYGNKYPTVKVHGCENSIEYVYGGGNAAAVASTDVTIWGGNKIGNVFGGGNGTVTAANVTGNTKVTIYGGTIGSVFGGSNSQGTIGGTITVNAVSQGEEGAVACPMLVDELYGGGNKAASNVGSISIGCMGDNDRINYVYGGANQADITGSINLLMSGGRIGNLFGGNNTSGNISGTITVTVNWDGSCNNNYLGNVFGGGNLATIGTAGSPKAPTVNILNGTVSGNVFGGGKGKLVDGADRGKAGKVTGSPTVTIGDNVDGHTAIISGDVYGGGDAADVAGTPVIVVNDCDTEIGYLYGGGNAADVNGTNITFNAGTVHHDAFGGGHGDKNASNPSKYADVKGNVVFNVYGGTFERVFAGSNSKGDITGSSTLTINKTGTCAMKIGEVYGGGNEADGNAGTITIGCTGTWTTTGDNNHANANTTDNRIGYELEGVGTVYGGANAADIGKDGSPSNITLNINSGMVNNVFGGNNSSGTIYGTIEVNIEKISDDCGWYVGNIYGGGNLAAYSGSPAVNVKNGTVSSNVYGGGKGSTAVVTGNPVVLVGDANADYSAIVTGDVYGGGDAAAVTGNTTVTYNDNNASSTVAKLFGGGNAAGVSGTATVNMTLGKVTAGIYGGCNSSGDVGDVIVNINGGTLGTSSAPLNSVAYGGIFGGGYGASTTTSGNVTVNFGDAAGTYTPEIYSDIYGGSALGQVNASNSTTTVNILSGTLHGDAYGGGLGEADVYSEETLVTDNSSKGQVNGNVFVNIGIVDDSGETPAYSGSATIYGSVYGCNNTNGSPKGNVTVNVYGTAHNTTNAATYTEDDGTNGDPTYAIDQVFGGGNQADYNPTSNTSKASVHVYTCDNTIRRVFGGGNAAASYGVETIIDGGRFDYVFGGGNGETLAADVGGGGVTLTVHSGVINHLFGGSNTNGTITGPMNVSVDNTGCVEQIKEFFGGGNLAVIGDENHPVNLSTTIACGTIFDAVYGGSNLADIYGNVELIIEGGTIGQVFGGSKGRSATSDPNNPTPKAADIYGNVTLDIHAGAIGDAFGGSNINGNITGSITVNLDWSQGDCGTPSINNIYGASNLASYTPTTPGSYPAVNIIHGTVTQSVFGGGKGSTAVVTSNPVVTIGDNNASHNAVVTGNVYGGGDAAPVTGHTNVFLTSGSLSNAFGGGNIADITGTTTVTLQGATVANIYGGGNEASVSSTSTVTLTDGNVSTGVYGGCNSSGTTGATEVNVLGGTVPDVFGGGLGQNTGVTGDVTVNVGAYDSSTDALSGTATVSGNVYGGSAKGSVNTSTSNTTAVNLWAGTVNGDVFGGGLGDLASLNVGGDDSHTDIAAAVNGNARVNLNGYDSGTAPALTPVSKGDCVVKGSIYGSNNYNGSVAGNSEVHVYKTVGWTDDNETPGDASDDISHVRTATPSTADAATYELLAVYGGGNQAAFTGTTTNVVIETCDPSIQSVYGGGNAADATNTSVLVRGAYEIGEVFGGGNGQVTAANVPGTATTVLNGGRIHDFYGGSNSQGTIGTWSDSDGSAGGTNITIDDLQIETDCSLNFDNIYGAGKNADVDGNIAMTMGCLSDAFATDNLFGGARAADIKGGITLTVTSGKFDRVFGGNDQSGVIGGNIVVNIEETGCKPLIIGQVFGGGNEADFGHNATINARSFTSIGEIYGGGNLADVNGSATVNILTALSTMNGNDISVYAGETKTIGGNSVTLPAHAKGAIGAIGYVYGGGLGAGTNVQGSIEVNIGSATDATISPVIINDVYGGSALGMVNATKGSNYSTDNTDVSATRDAETAVNIYNGSIGGSVFGGGLGQTSPSSVAAQNFGNTSVTMTSGTVSTAVYGGANVYGVLKGDSKVTITGGTVGTDPGSGAIQDVVFGGGYGRQTLVGGSVEVNIGTMTTGDTPAPTGTAIIWGNVYGGSAKGNVNAYLTGSPAALTASTDKTTDVNLYGGTIHGDLFGGGLGDNTIGSEVAANVYGPVTVTTKGGSANNVFGSNNFYGAPQSTVNVHIDGGTFGASVYGGGNLAAYAGGSIVVSMTDGSVGNDVFGGGLGSTAIVTGNTSVTVSGGGVTNSIYGGGSAANLTGNAEVTVSGGSAKTVYGGGNVADVSGNATVNITGGTLSGTAFDGVTAAVFGGGLGNTTTVGGTVTVNIGTRTGDAAPYTYGGTAAITGDVYGGSAKGKVNTTDGSSRTTGATTNVNLYGGTITGNLYGGGLGDATYAADVYGPVTVTTAGTGSADNVFGCNNLNGAPQSTVAVNIGGSTIAHNVYGGGNLADYTYADAGNPQNLTVTMSGGTVNENLFGGGLSADVAGGVSVTISGGTVVGDVYGGGALANTNTANWDASTGSTTYKLQVYGLAVGADVTGYQRKNDDTYTEVTEPGTVAVAGTTYYQYTGESYIPVAPGLLIVDETDVSDFYIKSDDSFVLATGQLAQSDVTYYQKMNSYSPVTSIKAGETVVTGYYTKTPGTYYNPTETTALEGVKYYEEKTREGTWKTGMTDPDTGATTYKTIVTLIGGTVGNAYGGGLGQAAVASQSIPAIEAMVYGDVTITVGDPTHAEDATAFTRELDAAATAASGSYVYKTGHLYGANNINGTPTGNVQVNVYKTRHKDHDGHQSGKDVSQNFEIQGVYGGGNVADYLPVAGKQTNVLIDGCDHVSIEFVYGGGNAASVPGTNVLIKACWEVGSAFGGGNGNDKILKPGTTNGWYYKGADVNGDTHIELKGGTIQWAFGGSNRLGDCTGDIYYDIKPGEEGDEDYCPLRITTLYGAGSNADVDGSLNLVIKCPSAVGGFIENVYAGSFNANIKGSVKMTIIGGVYQNVFGGNNQSGSITGPITIDVQESSDCQPVIIDKLFGGGNLAHYPTAGGSGGSITINVKSATRIGTIYGGGNQADVYGNTEVNVNMVHGRWAGQGAVIPKTYRTLQNITYVGDHDENSIDCTIKNEIGTIGDIYGGGLAGNIQGNATVNIGNSDKVTINTYNDDNIAIDSTPTDVLGAHITGNVYGGGYNGNVTGSTFVNIGATNLVAVPATGAYTFDAVNLFVPDPEDATKNIAEGVKIQGTEWQYGVFGGGNKGDVLGNSYVNLGAGSVMQSVYGGGCEADVKLNTYVTMLGGYVDDGVYGGGLKGSVGTFTRTTTGHASHADCVGGKPDKWERATAGTTSTASATGRNTGTCTVVISGGQVGPTEAANDGMIPNASRGVVDLGFVFGAGRGEVLDPATDPDVDFHCYVYDTDVTISGGLIMASVYGGGENGRVRNNTLVKIQGGQIGCGNGKFNKDGEGKPTTPILYDDDQFFDPIKTLVTGGDSGNALAEPSHWRYESPHDPYDPLTDKYHDPYGHASSTDPTDGKTYYGSVFGGGSGYYPYEKEDGTGYDWLPSAGWVEGNTVVNITGGHILTNVYGGNELTNVGTPGVANTGKCTVNMSGGTLGVPRTLEQIAAHPLSCYLFGAGKGNQRAHFNTWTCVNDVEVNVTGGIIYGSVFGGGEEGNVLRNTEVNISNGGVFTIGSSTYSDGPIIGTWGTSYVDGNVFGGGRGFNGETLLGGNVGGDVEIDISGGTMLGSIYGGGRLGSVGYGLYESGDERIGVMCDDNKDDDGNTVTGFSRGHVNITISGGKIGNDIEYDYIAPSVTGNALTTAKAKMPNTLHDSRNRLTHTKGGNVYAGGMGRRTDLNGTQLTNWQKLGNVKSAKLSITGGTIKSNVYGGGEFGTVTGVQSSTNDCGTEISISGGIIGTAIGTGDNLYYFGSVFGGGMGDESYGGGDVNKKTSVSIETGADVKKDVFGGGEFGHVGGNVVVEMTGGTVGNNLYGGGAFADTNTSNWDASANSGAGGWAAGMTSGSNTTYVHLTGGTIKHDAYGGGLGQWGNDDRAPKVYGNILVDLNGNEPSPGLSSPIASTSKGCIVERVFGCNDQNGTPKGHAKVHVHATQNKSNSKSTIRDKFAKKGVDLSGIDIVATLKTRLQEFVEVADKLGITVSGYASLIEPSSTATAAELHEAIDEITTSINTAADTEEGIAIVSTTIYDVFAVYGGGDLAAYEPKNTNEYCEVIIDGCDYSSIYHVYGGSNAAPAPATRVRVNATYEIHELFGGGNGRANFEVDGVYYENPGANVGYHNYTYYVTSDDANYSLATHGEGTLANPYKALDKADASTKELRQTNYRYGTGVANAEVAGGRIHYAYGGSDHKGNIATTSLSVYESMDDSCPLIVDETYGAGKDAPQDGEIDMAMDCVRNMEEIFGGAKNADVNADVKLTITNGSHFKRVFGGNNTSGAVAGSITVEIKESGCEPIKIEELYAGGYLADYSIYGYKKDGYGNYELPSVHPYGSERIALTKEAWETYKNTLRSAMANDLTQLGITATDQAVINAAINNKITNGTETERQYALEYQACKDEFDSYPKKEPLINVISATRIDNIYGGGYRALVVGSPHINVNMTDGKMLVVNKGTSESPVYKDVNGETHDASGVTSETIEGVTRYYVPLALGSIGNIYGGGNEADIDGDTYVEIGTGKWINRDEKWETEDASGYLYTFEDKTNNKSKWSEYEAASATDKANWKWYKVGGNGTAETTAPTPARNAAVIKYDATREFSGDGIVYGGGNHGDVKGNTYVTMDNGNVFNRIFGGGNMGHVGTIDTRTLPEGHASHDGCVGGKPTSFATNTGKSTVTVTGGYVGPFTVSGSVATPVPLVMPDDYGYVFGAGRGALTDPAVDTDIEFTAYVDNTEVTINGTALIAGGVYGGSENGRVLNDTKVYIQGGQIGLGNGLTEAYTDAQWTAAENAVKSANYASIDAAVLTECNAWAYGKIYEGKTAKEWLPYDPHATESTPDARPLGSDGHTFYGNVFGGGSGFFTYEKSGGGYEWLPSAGLVEGDTYLEISGGHILTSAYGGNEMSDVTGTCHVKMTGGTLGVPRTLAQIADHPVTCYLFGGGKGDPRDHFNSRTNVGKAEVEVSGGVIYGSVFGGGEDGHVLGDAIVTIKDTKDESDNVIASPWIGTWGTSYVDGNVFGAGRGFSGLALTAGSVGGNAKVNISGGRMLGSIYGGGRMAAVGVFFADRTILDNNNNPIPNPNYGLLHDDVADDPETSGVDEAKAYGHVTVDISGGTIGNDLEFIPVPRNKKTEADLSAWKAEKHIPNTDFYLGKDDNDDDLYLLRHTKGGNVFGGSMGRNTFLDGSINPLWPKLAVVKLTEVTIRGTANIKGNVYGGGEFGVVRNRATVNVKGGTIQGDVYGGGYGSDDDSDASRVAITAGGYSSIPTNYYTFTPMIWNGCVSGNTFVNVSGGWVKRNVYGGGEMASVGLINYNSDAAGNYNYITKHDNEFNSFVLSWPYEFQYIAPAPMDLESVGGGVTAVGGKTTVNITGGRIGITGKDYTGPEDISDIIDSGTTTEDEKDARRTDNGDVFGGSKGIPENDRYRTAFSSNVKETEVKINYPSDNAAAPDNYKDTPDEGKTYTYDCIAGSVYGGGEDGHVIEDSHVRLTKGLVGHAIYGGGKGKTKFKTTLLKEGASAYLKPDGGDRNKVEDYTNEAYKYEADVYGFISGKVYGNTHVEMTDGYVVRNIYGGGNMASVGKGNYAGGADDYFTFGYGELTSIPPNLMAVNLWTPSEGFNPQATITASNKPTTMADYFLCSGKTSVTVKGGQVGYIQTSNPSKSVKDDLPYGNIFGGCRGESTPNTNEIPPYLYNPTFYAGFVNETEVTVGTDGASTGPKILGSVYGGGQDGHVRRDTHVRVYSGEIGIPFTVENRALFGKTESTPINEELDNLQWLHRGNVYGSGSGIGKYKFDYNYDGVYNDENETGYGQSAGSVTRFSQVDIYGGTIHRNVYGGGSQSSVGPPDSGLGPYNVWRKGDTNPAHNGPGWQSQNTVNIYGTIGSPTYNEVYGGEVYGGSRGNASLSDDFSTSVWTLVHIKDGAYVKGNVFGGGDSGKVKKDTDVKIGGE